MIAYNTKSGNETDTNAAYYNLSISYSLGSGSLGNQFNQFDFSMVNRSQILHYIFEQSFS